MGRSAAVPSRPMPLRTSSSVPSPTTAATAITQSQRTPNPTAAASNTPRRSGRAGRAFGGVRIKRVRIALVNNESLPVSRSARRAIPLSGAATSTLSSMGLAEAFQGIIDSLPDDWTDLEIDLRLLDEERYIDAAVLLTQVNAQPYSKADWHWRLLVAHRFGHAAAAETVKGTLVLLDREGIEGEMVVRDVREGRAEVVQMWGRPESVRREFRRSRSL